jgi:hypothetical protein
MMTEPLPELEPTADSEDDRPAQASLDLTPAPATRRPLPEIVLITPQDAEKFLENALAHRPVNKAAVEAYAAAMREGRWRLNGESILVDKTGTLIDGVQRMHACKLSGVPFATFIVHGIERGIVNTIDQHRRRNYRDLLRSRGESNVASLEGALIWLMRYKDSTMPKRAVPIVWDRLDRILERNGGLRKKIAETVNHKATVLNEAIRSPLAYMGSKVDPAAVDKLLDQLANPDDYDAGDPGVVLRARLETERDRLDRINRHTKFAIAILALNDIIKRKRSRAYNWLEEGRNATPFPEIWDLAPSKIQESRPQEGEVSPSNAARTELRNALAGRKITWAIETITPETADKYLEANTKNRKIVKGHVAALARDMKAGHFQLNWKAICFSPEGRLLNGQHRLNAVKEAETSIETLVLRGIDEDAYETFDVNAKRGVVVSDLVSGRAVDQAQVKAAAVLLWHELNPELPHGSKPTPAEVRQLITDNPGLVAQRLWADANRDLGPPAVLNYLAFRFERDHPRIAAEFLHKLANPEEVTRGNPIKALRARLLKFKEDKSRSVDRWAVKKEIEDGFERFRAYRRGA